MMTLPRTIACLPGGEIQRSGVTLPRHELQSTKKIITRGKGKETLGGATGLVQNRGSVSTPQTEMKADKGARRTGPAGHVPSLHPLRLMQNDSRGVDEKEAGHHIQNHAHRPGTSTRVPSLVLSMNEIEPGPNLMTGMLVGLARLHSQGREVDPLKTTHGVNVGGDDQEDIHHLHLHHHRTTGQGVVHIAAIVAATILIHQVLVIIVHQEEDQTLLKEERNSSLETHFNINYLHFKGWNGRSPRVHPLPTGNLVRSPGDPRQKIQKTHCLITSVQARPIPKMEKLTVIQI